MCMQDIVIARASRVAFHDLSLDTTHTNKLPANPYRVGLIITPIASVSLFLTFDGAPISTGRHVIDDTLGELRLLLRDYGQAITLPIAISVSVGAEVLRIVELTLPASYPEIERGTLL